MEIVKCIKVIVPGSGSKSAKSKKHIVEHVSRKKIAGASAFGRGVLNLPNDPKPPQTPPMTMAEMFRIQ